MSTPKKPTHWYPTSEAGMMGVAEEGVAEEGVAVVLFDILKRGSGFLLFLMG